MKQHQIRVVDEKTDLDGKIERLDAFIGTPIYHDLDGHDQFLLRFQLVAMRQYSTTLGERIARFDLSHD